MHIVFVTLLFNLVFVPFYVFTMGAFTVKNRDFHALDMSSIVEGIDGIIQSLTPFILILAIFYKVEFFGQQAEENDGTTNDQSKALFDDEENMFDFATEPRGSISSKVNITGGELKGSFLDIAKSFNSNS